MNHSDQKGCATLRFNQMERQLRRIKNQTFPASPTNGNEIITIFSDVEMLNLFGKTKHDEPAIFYKGTLVHRDYTCTFFASDKIIAMIGENLDPNNRKYLMDATFKIVPVGCFSQILIMYIECLGHVSYTISNPRSLSFVF